MPADSVQPVVLLSSNLPDPTNVSPLSFTATFTKDVVIHQSKVEVSGGKLVGVSGAPREFTLLVEPAGDDLLVTLTLPEGAAEDPLGNPNAAGFISVQYGTICDAHRYVPFVIARCL